MIISVRRMLFVLFGFISFCFAIADTVSTPRVKVIPEAVGNFINYEQFEATTAQKYINSINSFLSTYDQTNQVENLRYCDFNNRGTENSSVCAFDKASLGRCTQLKDFGFPSASPCVFFTLSQVLNWVPLVLNGSEIQRHSDPFLNIPDHLNSSLALNETDQFSKEYIWLTCDGENAADKEFMGPITYYPHKGFPTYYFPFTNTHGYQSPIVAIHFERPMKGVAITIICRAWAKNIQLDWKKGTGFVKFLLLID